MLAQLRCLKSGSKLHWASADLLERINLRVTQGTLTDQLGRPIDFSLQQALANEDETMLYHAPGGVPNLVREESITVPR